MVLPSFFLLAIAWPVVSFGTLFVREERISDGDTSSSAGNVPLFNIRPPLPISNGSTISQLASSGTQPRILSTEFPTEATASASASNVATYDGHVFRTHCPSGDAACLTTCKSYVESCSADFNSWSALRRSYQSSKADGSMPMTTSLHIQTEKGTTIWKYETSWLEYALTTQVEGWGAGSLGMTTTVLTDSTGGLSTSTGYKSGLLDIVYTSSIPIAIGGTGTPVSTSEAHYNTFTFEQTSWYDFDVPRPSCWPSSWTDCRYSSDCNKCTISGGTVQLLYFPVPQTKASHEISSSVTASAALETAVYKNVTLTSPSVYISFQTASAQNDCGTQVGKRYPGAILPLPLSDLSSVYGGYGTLYSSDPLAPLGAVSNTPYLAAGQFNLADLNWPPPMSAYTNQLKFALGREIFSIMTQPYNPHLAVPGQVRSLDPAWASCGLDWEGLYDPPTALQPAEAAAKPTMSTTGHVYTSARPHSSPSTVPATSKQDVFFTAPSTTKESNSPNNSNDHESQLGATEDPQLPSTTVEPTGVVNSHLSGSQKSSGEPQKQKPSDPSTSLASSQVVGPADAVTQTVEDPSASATVSAANEIDAVPAERASATFNPWTMDPSEGVDVSPKHSSNEDVREKSRTFSKTNNEAALDTAATQNGHRSVTLDHAPLIVAVGSQTVTADGSAQTISDQLVSLAPTEIIIGSSEIGIPRIEAGTQHISLPVGESPGLMGMTFIAGQASTDTRDGTSATRTRLSKMDGPTLDPTVQRAIFTLGTHTYTAIQTGGTAEAVIGKTTLMEGQAVSLSGGTVSLVSGHLELEQDQSRGTQMSQQTTTAKASERLESKSSLSSKPATPSVTSWSSVEMPEPTAASTTTSSSAKASESRFTVRVALVALFMLSAWFWML